MCQYHLFSPAFRCKELRQKRLDLGLDATAPALFLCDDADQHRNPAYKRLREIWMKENNAIILGSSKGDRNVPDVPGGRWRVKAILRVDSNMVIVCHSYVHTEKCIAM